MLEIPVFQSSSYRNTDFLMLKYRKQEMKYRNTVRFFSKYRNTGQKKDQSRDTEKVQTPPLVA